MGIGVSHGWSEKERNVSTHRPVRYFLEALLNDPQALVYLHHPHQEAVIAIAVGAYRDIEVHPVIHVIGVCLPQIPGNARRPEIWAADGAVYSQFTGEDPDALGASQNDLVLQNQSLKLTDVVGEVRQQRTQSGPELGWGILGHSAGSHVAHCHSSTTYHLKEVQNALTLTEAVHQRCPHSAKVLQEEPDAHEVAGDSLKF